MLLLATTPPQGLPLDDPQFWIVTAAALCAGGWIAWRMVPKRWIRKKRGTATRATLTVGGKAVGSGPRRSPPSCH